MKLVVSRFLACISYHLSGRNISRGKEYILQVNKDGTFQFSISASIYPDRNHRARAYALSPVTHVLQYHMPELIDNDDQVQRINTYMVPPGRYVYMYNINHTKRKWVKLDGEGINHQEIKKGV